MSGWNDIDKPSGGTGGGRFVQFESDKAVRMRILDEEPYTTRVHKISQMVTKGGKSEEVFRSITATASPDDSFILRHNAKRYPEQMQFNMRVFVYAKDDQGKDTDEGEIKILQGGPAIFKPLRTIYTQEGSLSAFDIIITRKGAGRDTEYTVSAAARSRTIDVKPLIDKMNTDVDLAWDRIFLPITGDQQKKMMDEAGLDINYDPAAELAASMTIEQARTKVISFGKYKGKTINELMAIDAGYLSWAAENITTNEELAAACRVADGHLRGISASSEPVRQSLPEKAAPAPKAEAKAEAPKAEPKAEAKPVPTQSSEELKAQITDWFESDSRFEDVQEVVTIIKKHGEGKTRLKDLTAGQMQNLLDDLKATAGQ